MRAVPATVAAIAAGPRPLIVPRNDKGVLVGTWALYVSLMAGAAAFRGAPSAHGS